MRRTRRILLAEMGISLLVAAVVVLLFESGILMPGALSHNTQGVFVATATMQLLTIGAIPLAMYMFRIPFVSRRLTEDDTAAHVSLLHWGSVRMLMLCVLMIANSVLYYLTSMTVSFAYMAVVLAVSLAFIYPSENRCRYETTKEEKR